MSCDLIVILPSYIYIKLVVLSVICLLAVMTVSLLVKTNYPSQNFFLIMVKKFWPKGKKIVKKNWVKKNFGKNL